MLPQTLITTYLEMTIPQAFRPAFLENDRHLQITRLGWPDVEYYRFLYRAVGEMWRWRDRLLMPEEELRTALAPPQTLVDVLYVEGAPAGYVELAQQGTSVEIAYFGLRAHYFGRGLGGHLLSYGIQQAWELPGTQRVWVHTCNLDGPHALENYIKRGFTVYDRQEEPMPDRYA